MTNQSLRSGSLPEAIKQTVSDYLILLEDHQAVNLHQKVIDVIELPLLEVTMKHTRGNQSRAAICLGISQTTLRSKLKRHGLWK